MTTSRGTGPRRVPKDPKLPLDHWLVRYREPGGKQPSRRFQTKTEALRFWNEISNQLASSIYIDPSSRLTVADYAAKVIGTKPGLRDSSADHDDQVVRCHLTPTRLGKMRLLDVRQSDVAAWVKDRQQHLAPSTLRTHFRLVKWVFRQALGDREIGLDPAAAVSLPRVVADDDTRPDVALSHEQIEAQAEAMPRQCQAMVVGEAGTGVRPGELYALRVQDLDFARQLVHVTGQINAKTRQRDEITKTSRSRRTVPMTDEVRDALVAHLAEFPAGPDGFLFTAPDGLPYWPSAYRDVFGKARTKAGLPGWVTPHDLRHHFASVHLNAGVVGGVKTVSAWLGHKNSSITSDFYEHLMPKSDDASRAVMEASARASREREQADRQPGQKLRSI